jgi:hypothetical protein
MRRDLVAGVQISIQCGNPHRWAAFRSARNGLRCRDELAPHRSLPGLQSRRPPGRIARQDSAQREFDRPDGYGRSPSCPLLHLPAGLSGERTALLRQQAFFRHQGARHRRPLLYQAKPAADEMDGESPVQARHSNVDGRRLRSAHSRFRSQANCATPWPTDQFSLADSRMFTNTFSGRMPGFSPSSSAVRRYSAFFCSTVRVSNTVIWM